MNFYLEVIVNIIDIVISTVIIYGVLKIIVRTEKMIFIINGIIMFIVLYWFAVLIGLKIAVSILSSVFSWGIVLIFILFQDEIRSILEMLGNTGKNKNKSILSSKSFINEFVDACFLLASKKEGALITFEMNSSLTKYTEKAIKIDSEYSTALLTAIFNKESSIHDGAVIIKNERIEYAGTFFPIEVGLDLDKAYGTRHRAAITISKETDAITVIISEERGEVSIAYKENLYSNVEKDFIIEYLTNKIENGGK